MAHVLTKELKESVLQAAIQGKLSIKNCTDTPVQTTLKAIKELQTDLYKKKIEKPTKPTREVNDIEFFDIPEHWQWVELSQIGTMTRGSGIKKTEVTQTGFPCVRYGQLYTTFKDKFDKAVSFVPENIFKSCKKAHQGDVLMSLTGENNFDIALAVVYEGLEEIAIGGDMMKLSNHCMNPYYLSFVLNSEYGISWKRKMAKGNIIVHISNDKLANIMIPTPPVEEQARIVAKVNELMAKIDEYEKLENQLVQLKEQFPKDMRDSLLQAAIQGKLTKQLKNDTSVEEILKSIEEQKKTLIKEDKLQKKKSFHLIRNDEIPFDIPDNWVFAKLGYISTYDEAKQKINARDANDNLWMLDLEDIAKGGTLLCKKRVFERKAIGDKTIFEKGSILYSKLRPYLLKILIADEDGICTPELVPFKMYGGINTSYIALFLKSPYVDSEINKVTYGVKMPRVGTKTMVNFYVPLPPIEEQQRIVDKLDEMLPLVDALAQMD